MLFSGLLSVTVALALLLRAVGSIEQTPVKLGDPVVLKCKISLHHEIFWMKVSMIERPRLLMVTRLKHDGNLTEVLNYNSTHYEGCLVDKSFGLKVSSVLITDLGSYYCGIIEGKRIEFEDGVHIYDIKDERVSNNKEAIFTPPPVADRRQISYLIFASVLCVGLLLMVLVVFSVHMMTCRKIN